MRLIINLCCFSLPPSLQVLGKGVGMEGEGGMEGRVEAEREEGLPILPSPSSKPWKKQARPHPSSPPALLRGLQESGCVGSGWRAGWSFGSSSAAASCVRIFQLRGPGGWTPGPQGASLLPHACHPHHISSLSPLRKPERTLVAEKASR